MYHQRFIQNSSVPKFLSLSYEYIRKCMFGVTESEIETRFIYDAENDLHCLSQIYKEENSFKIPLYNS